MKMNSASRKRDLKLLPRQIIVGRWHQRSYRIVRELGFGATGTVYLAEAKTGSVALKIASDSMSITSEVNVLRHFSKVQGPSLGPSFFDADDYIASDGVVFPFYVMEYIDGKPFLPFLKNRGGEWLGIMVVQLLGDLHRLHQAGWIFGDLKPENLLVTGNPYRVRWLDVGGMTKEGRAIKEYTEFFDRGYWGYGGRKAEPSYDLFSVSMLMINRAYPSRFEKHSSNGNLTPLVSKIKEKEILVPYEVIINKGLEGRYESAMDMRKELMELIQITTFTPYKNTSKKSNTTPSEKKRRGLGKKKHPSIQGKRERRFVGVFESMLFASFLLILYILYLFGQTV